MEFAMRVKIEKDAEKQLERMQPKLAAAILAEIKEIAIDPFGHHPAAKPLKGRPNAFRMRHGIWRVLYDVDRANGWLVVKSIETRDKAYR